MAIDGDGLTSRPERYERAVAPLERTLRRALVARFGVDAGCDATADALAWAWEHLDRIESMANPAGYLYRVGQSAAKRARRLRRPAPVFPRENQLDGQTGTDLFDALRRLPQSHRVAIVMVHAYGFTYREVADLLEVSESAVTNYVHRGLAKARILLEDQP